VTVLTLAERPPWAGLDGAGPEPRLPEPLALLPGTEPDRGSRAGPGAGIAGTGAGRPVGPEPRVGS
jgi:hypothetical protein